MLKKPFATIASALALTIGAAAFGLAGATAAQAAPVKNIVLVHGAFADGSGWRKVSDILRKDGYNVATVQEPLTSLADDVAATKRVLDLQSGPSILVGHSYGGVVITQAGTADNVAGLVYIAAFEPDKGESLISLASTKPAATKGVTATKDGFLYLDPKVFPADFAADLPKADAEYMAHSQVFIAQANFGTPVTDPAWRVKKSWALVSTEDRAINPDLERSMAQRAGSTTIEVKASHAVYASQPKQVAHLIEEAAKASGN
jgi:pimeloyl-ACP methyl ester carboxylesterase